MERKKLKGEGQIKKKCLIFLEFQLFNINFHFVKLSKKDCKKTTQGAKIKNRYIEIKPKQAGAELCQARDKFSLV